MTTIPHRPLVLVVAATAVLFMTTGCGGSTTNTPTNPPVSTSHPAGSPTGFPSTPPSGSPTTATITQAELDAAMLDRNDVGYRFVVGTYQPNTQGGPCEPTGTPSVDERVPPELSAGRTFDSGVVNAAITQNATIYSTSAQAALAFALAVRGTSCRHGMLSDGTEVTISPGHDVTAQVNGADAGKSTAWQLSNGSVRAVIVATLAGRVADACIFVAAANVDTSQLPDPLALAKVAFDKLRAH